MRSAPMILLAGALTLAVLTGCSKDVSPEPDETSAGIPTEGSRLAPGLHEITDGRVQAVGTLEYRDLEGGLWAIVGGTEADGNLGEVAAVIANADEYEAVLDGLEGKNVIATGTRFEGASIRMAGPEIVITEIAEDPAASGPQ